MENFNIGHCAKNKFFNDVSNFKICMQFISFYVRNGVSILQDMQYLMFYLPICCKYSMYVTHVRFVSITLNLANVVFV